MSQEEGLCICIKYIAIPFPWLPSLSVASWCLLLILWLFVLVSPLTLVALFIFPDLHLFSLSVASSSQLSSPPSTKLGPQSLLFSTILSGSGFTDGEVTATSEPDQAIRVSE